MLRDSKGRGFTIVELLIVIVVVAILAAITIVAYNGISARANDSKRMQDIASIQKALEVYRVDNGRYPSAVANPGISGWEASIDSGFLDTLSTTASKMPVDPVNTTGHYYGYYRYPAGSFSCPASLGAFYVLRAYGLESVDGVAKSEGVDICPSAATGSRLPSAKQAVFFGFESI